MRSAYTILFLLVAGHLPAQETLTGVQRELTRVEREIQREKKLHEQEKKQAAGFQKRRKEKLAAIEEQLSKLDAQMGTLNKEQSVLKKKVQGLKGRIHALQNKRKEVSQALEEEIDSWVRVFQADFPHMRDGRISALEKLKDDLKSGAIGPEEGFNRLYTLLQSAISLGYETEVYSGTYQDSESKVHDGKYVRLGAVFLGFIANDGERAAILEKTDSAWVWRDRDLDPASAGGLRRAVSVAEAKAEPQLVPLPFTVTSASIPEGGKASRESKGGIVGKAAAEAGDSDSPASGKRGPKQPAGKGASKTGKGAAQ